MTILFAIFGCLIFAHILIMFLGRGVEKDKQSRHKRVENSDTEEEVDLFTKLKSVIGTYTN